MRSSWEDGEVTVAGEAGDSADGEAGADGDTQASDGGDPTRLLTLLSINTLGYHAVFGFLLRNLFMKVLL